LLPLFRRAFNRKSFGRWLSLLVGRNRDASCLRIGLPMQRSCLWPMQKLGQLFLYLRPKRLIVCVGLKSALATYPGYRLPYTFFVVPILSGYNSGWMVFAPTVKLLHAERYRLLPLFFTVIVALASLLVGERDASLSHWLTDCSVSCCA